MFFNLCAFQKLCSCSCNKNKIPIAFNQIILKYRLIGGSNNPTGAVAFNGIADFFACCDSNTANTHTVFHCINNQCRLCRRFSPIIEPAKIGILIYRNIFLQSNQIPTQYWTQMLFNSRLISKLLSTLWTSAGKNFAAVSCWHSLAEAMLHFSVALLGLISSFHLVNLLLILIIKTGHITKECEMWSDTLSDAFKINKGLQNGII